jgi:hypothetical protein
MYVANGAAWARRVEAMQDYQPPRLFDIVALAEKKRAEGISVYLGLHPKAYRPNATLTARPKRLHHHATQQGIIMNGTIR